MCKLIGILNLYFQISPVNSQINVFFVMKKYNPHVADYERCKICCI